jgi:hypothetical protein
MPASSRLEEEFFRFDSVPPVVEQIDEPESARPPSEPVPAAVLARRRRLRRGVGAIVALTAALTVTALVHGMLVPGRAVPAALARPATARLDAGGALRAARQAPTVAPQPRPAAELAGGAPPGASSAVPASASADASTPSGTAAELRQATLRWLARREPARAAAWARALIAAEPEDAFGYLCLGSALQDQGKWGEAHQAYAQCVHRAKRGDVGECGALGGRR